MGSIESATVPVGGGSGHGPHFKEMDGHAKAHRGRVAAVHGKRRQTTNNQVQRQRKSGTEEAQEQVQADNTGQDRACRARGRVPDGGILLYDRQSK